MVSDTDLILRGKECLYRNLTSSQFHATSDPCNPVAYSNTPVKFQDCIYRDSMDVDKGLQYYRFDGFYWIVICKEEKAKTRRHL